MKKKSFFVLKTISGYWIKTNNNNKCILNLERDFFDNLDDKTIQICHNDLIIELVRIKKIKFPH